MADGGAGERRGMADGVHGAGARVWVAKRLDFAWSDLGFAATAWARAGDREEERDAVERLWSPEGRALVTLSVRSAFDLLLSALDWSEGDEVLFSALTVSDMPRIVRAHGLVPVPVDIEVETAAPTVDAVLDAVGPRTRMLVLAHLYGGRIDADRLIDGARERGLLVVEDCAQAFAGTGWTGHDASDVTLFSFGTIKHASALGGGLARVADPDLLGSMRRLHRRWPLQGTADYTWRALKYAGLHALSGPRSYALATRSAAALGMDPEAAVHGLTRGFAGAGFFRRIRRRPSTPLLAMLRRRLRQDPIRLRDQGRRGDRLVRRLAPAEVPGRALEEHRHWLVPVLSRDPDGLVAHLRAGGFDATRGRSLEPISAPDGRAEPVVARRVHARSVYLPFSPVMPEGELDRMAARVRDFEAGIGG